MGRAPCYEKNGLKRGPWTPEEDQKLIDYIQTYGYGNWRTLPKNAGLQRCGKSCRLRWTNYLRPDIKRGKFSFGEEETIIQLHSILGNKWSAIAARLPGRTDNEIKNYWNTHIRKRLLRMGIDPVTHSPRLDLLDISSMLGNSSPYYNNNSSSLFGLQQPMVNQDLLKLVTSLFSNQRQNHPHPKENEYTSNAQIHNNFDNSLLQTTQFQNHIPITTAIATTDIVTSVNTTNSGARLCAPLHDEAQLMEPNYKQYPTNIQNLDSQNLKQWLSNGLAMLEDLINVPHTSCEYYDSHQILMDPSYMSNNISTFQSNISIQQSVLSYASPVMSTSSSSSPTHLNSSSNSTTYVNGSGTEDERESYCSDMIKFELPDLVDVNQILLSQTN